MRLLILIMAALTLPGCATADLIVGSLPGTNLISFGAGGANNCSGGASTAVVGGFNISTDGAACLPWSNGWSFADNGQWFLPALVDNSGTTTITIDLNGSYSMVLGFMNYALSCGSGFGDPCTYQGNDPTVTALDKNKNVLESYDIAGILNGSSAGDIDYLAGDTVGIARATSDIAYLQIGGDYIGITNISVSNAPEPGPLVLCFLAMAALLVSRNQLTSAKLSRRRPID